MKVNEYKSALDKVKLNETKKENLKNLYYNQEYSREGRIMNKNNRRLKYGLIAACMVAVLTISGIISGIHNTNNNNQFSLMVSAEEMKTKGVVYVDDSNTGTQGYSYGFSTDDKGNLTGVTYGITFLPVKCKGKDIDTVTYSINKGAFRLFYNDEYKYIFKDKTMYKGDGLGKDDMYKDELDNCEFVTSYTVDYDNQPSEDIPLFDEFQIDIFGDTSYYDDLDTDYILNHINDDFSEDDSYNTVNKEKRLWDKCLENLEITCTVKFKDGSTAAKVIGLTPKVMAFYEKYNDVPLEERGTGETYLIEWGYTLK
jgi:hypothetical protein